MVSRWSHLKESAIKLRQHGASVRDIENRLGIPRSNLSYSFRGIVLSKRHKQLLRKRHENALIIARKEAVKWHNAQKERRMQDARMEALKTLSQIDITKKEIVELALAILYLGEGAKKNSFTAMGNSDSRILRFFVDSISYLYDIPRSGFRCHLHIRADQNSRALARYWASALDIPLKNFLKPLVDKRTLGTKSDPHYKGVCAVSCGRVAIQRKLMYIATQFCEKAAESRAVSSLGRAHR